MSTSCAGQIPTSGETSPGDAVTSSETTRSKWRGETMEAILSVARVTKDELCHRFDVFAEGEWHTLLCEALIAVDAQATQ